MLKQKTHTKAPSYSSKKTGTPRRAIKEIRQLALDEIYNVPTSDYSLAIDTEFPEKFANQLAQQEAFNKHLFRPNTYLHKWWARRCGSTFRAILKQFVPDSRRRDYYTNGGLEGKIVLDPMMGGGTTLHEAIRLGATVIGADVDPIPIVQARATLTQVALSDLRLAFNNFFESLYQEVGHYFQTECPECNKVIDSLYTLYGLRKKCLCHEVVQLDQYELRQEDDRTIRIWAESWAITDSKKPPRQPAKDVPLITREDIECPCCKHKYKEINNVPFYARYVPIAVAGNCPDHGIFFRMPSEADRERIRQADQARQGIDFGPVSNFAVRNGPKSSDLLARNITSYLDLFSSRQLLYLSHAIRLLNNFKRAIQLNLGLLVSTSLEFNSLLCGYKGWSIRRPGAIRHVFALHAYSFPYTAAENNPLNREKSSGNLQLLFRDRIERGRKWAVAPVERKVDRNGKAGVVRIPGELDGGTESFDQASLKEIRQAFWLIHGDSRRLPVSDHSVDFVVTDPPYYNNVQYSDLATFFRVWLARLLPGEVDWAYDHNHSAVATKATEEDSGFINVIAGIFRECGRVLRCNTGRLVFTFHHWDPNAWAELTIALKQSDFRLINCYIVFSENPISVHINKLNAITHDVILVLALNENTSLEQWPSLKGIDTSASEKFCRQCGAALGWLLESPYSPSEIRIKWNELIKTRVNGNH